MFPASSLSRNDMPITPTAANDFANYAVDKITQRRFHSSPYMNDTSWIANWQIHLMLAILHDYTQDYYFMLRSLSPTITEIAGLDLRIEFAASNERINIVHVTKNAHRVFNRLGVEYNNFELKGVSLSLQNDAKHTIRVYQKDDKITVFTTDMNWTITRRLIALYPILFSIEMPDNIKEIFKAFGGSDYNVWYALMTAHYKTLNLHLIAMEKELTKYFAQTVTQVQNKLQNRTDTYKTNIEDYTKSIAQAYQDLRKAEAEIAYLILNPKTQGEDEKQFLLNNRQITAIRTLKYGSQTFLQLNIIAPLIHYDADALGTLLKSSSHKLNGTAERIKPLFEGMREGRFIMNVENVVSIDHRGDNRPHAESRDGDWGRYFQTNFPANPHLERFNCWGSNEPHIMKAIKNNDLIGAVSQMIGAVYNLNVLDSTVFNHFLDKIKDIHDSSQNTSQCILDMKDNQHYTIREAVKRYEADKVAEAVPQTNPSQVVEGPNGNEDNDEEPELFD